MTAVPILAFHAIEEGPAPLCIPPAVFERAIAGLQSAGYEAMTVSQAAMALAAGMEMPERTVALTFDDGYRSVHRAAFPILEQAGWPATVFPVTGHLGGTNGWDRAEALRALALMNAFEIREVHAGGWEVGAHTHSHRSLPALPRHESRSELAGSKAILEDLLQAPVCSVAYPYGHHDPSIRALAAELFDVGLTIGTARARRRDDLTRLPRIDGWYLRRGWHTRRLDSITVRTYLTARGAGRALKVALGAGSG